ncbi:MAG: hypothetical protein KJ077_11140 [Anaerolineae bacterium]|nr:hypothetical protein [Anaerolineae bacterium]
MSQKNIYRLSVVVEPVTDDGTRGFGMYESPQKAHRVAKLLGDGHVIGVLRTALADLYGIMPEFEPSGDREHSGWETIAELRDMVASLEGDQTVFEEYPGEFPGRPEDDDDDDKELMSLPDWVEKVAILGLEPGQQVVVTVHVWSDFGPAYDLEVESSHGTLAGVYNTLVTDEAEAYTLGKQLEEILAERGYQIYQEWPDDDDEVGEGPPPSLQDEALDTLRYVLESEDTSLGDGGSILSEDVRQAILAVLAKAPAPEWLERWGKEGDDIPCPECGEAQIETQDGLTLCHACGWHADNPLNAETNEENEEQEEVEDEGWL